MMNVEVKPAWFKANPSDVHTMDAIIQSYNDILSNSQSSSPRPGTPINRIKRSKISPRVRFKQDIETIFHKHRKSSKSKNNDDCGPPEKLSPNFGSTDLSFNDKQFSPSETNSFKGKVKGKQQDSKSLHFDHDLTDIVRKFNEYLSEKIVRLSLNPETKVKYLWSNLDVEKKTEREKVVMKEGKQKRVRFYQSSLKNESPQAINEPNTSDEEFHLPAVRISQIKQTIRDFEKRNVKRTLSKIGDIESLFISMKPVTPQSSTTESENDYDTDTSPERGTGRSHKDVHFPKIDRRGSLHGESTMTVLPNRSFRLRKAIRKVQQLLADEKGSKMKKSIASMLKNKESQRTRKHSKTPLERFRHAGRLILLALRAVGIKPEKPEDNDYNFLSWTILYDELGISRTPYDHSGLMFDPQQFRASKESFLSHDVKEILLKKPTQRTDYQIQQVIRFLAQIVPAFGEYPMRIQRATLKCCTLECFESGRVIIRQGHRADNFYFIISGTAVVTVMESGANHVHTVNSLGSGNSFGELAFLNMSQRTATVTCRENMELLSIEREDFIEIFMRRIKGQEPEHMTFLKSLDILQGWPIEKLPLDNLKICAFTYVRRGIVLCANSSNSDWLFIVVSGTCKILKALNDAKGKRDQRKRKRECPKSDEEHIQQLEAIFNRRHVLPSVNVEKAENTPKSAGSNTSEKRSPDHKPTQALFAPPVLIKPSTPSQFLRETSQNFGIQPQDRLGKGRQSGTGFQFSDVSSMKKQPNKVFIHVARLEPGNIFGLEQVVMSGREEVTTTSLVSDGAEVVIINKKFFRKHLTEETAKRIRKEIRAMPSEYVLQQNFINQKSWDVFKLKTLEDTLQRIV